MPSSQSGSDINSDQNQDVPLEVTSASFENTSTSPPDQSADPSSDVTAPSLIDLRRYDQSWFDRGRPGWLILLWWLVQAIAFPLTPHPFNSLRASLLRLFGARIGQGVVIRPTARFSFPWKVEIGDYSWIGDDVVFYSLDHIRVGQHSVISQQCYLCTGSHNFRDVAFGLVVAPITIGNGVWVASDCFISPGVCIGSNAVIGARSSVMADVLDQHVCWGNPCRCHYLRTMQCEG